MFKRFFIRCSIAIVSVLGVASFAAGPACPGERDIDSVKILAINDFHGQLTTGQKVSGRPAGGAAVLASYLKSAGEEWDDDNIFLVEAGDLAGASQPECALLQDEPAIMFLNAMKRPERGHHSRRREKELTVIGAIGNHELDEGIYELGRLLGGGNFVSGPFLENPWGGAKFPVINANMTYEATGRAVLPPFFIANDRSMRVPIAFIGAMLEETPTMVSASSVAGLQFADEVSTINTYVKILQRRGIHAFVVLLHEGGSQISYSGWTDTLKPPPSSDIVSLISGLDDDVDVVCTAHSHSFTNALVRNGNGVPILVTQAYAKGTAYADIELKIDRTKKDIVAKRACIVTTFADVAPGTSPDPEIRNLVASCSTMVAPLTGKIISFCSKLTKTA